LSYIHSTNNQNLNVSLSNAVFNLEKFLTIDTERRESERQLLTARRNEILQQNGGGETYRYNSNNVMENSNIHEIELKQQQQQLQIDRMAALENRQRLVENAWRDANELNQRQRYEPLQVFDYLFIIFIYYIYLLLPECRRHVGRSIRQIQNVS
jgi:hypothetical protein